MKVFRRKRAGLDERLAALAEAAEAGDGRVPVEGARAVLDRAGARRRLSLDHTVVALAGATGSGKSSLFNALAGSDLAEVGVIRPTTSTAQAAIWDGEGAAPLLDWLEIPRRHEVTADPALGGLVLLDLPDHDSIELGHRLEADRLVELVDLLVWVVDPQKYADAALHERYLRPLAGHRDVMLVVLNQTDRLSPAAGERCLTDLRARLDDDGLPGIRVLGVSARTGAGLDDLRGTLHTLISAHDAWSANLTATITSTARSLLTPAADGDAGREGEAVHGRLTERLTGALSEAAGVPLVVSAVAKAHRHRSIAATGWPVTRWLRRFRADPLRRLGLAGSAGSRTSLPAASGVQRSQVDTAIRDLAQDASSGLPEAWASAVRQAARSHATDLPDRLDRVVGEASSGGAARPRWWRATGVLQWLLLAVMLGGALWLTGLFALDYLRFPEPPTPTVGDVPWPTALLLGGVIAGILVALAARALAWLGGRRRARRTAKALRSGIDEVARELVVAPVDTELDRHDRFVKAATLAATGDRG
ncbi:YfjP family GTPase [Spongiactinospora sp. TRM90649]|uniref:GTPase family protein n=1 Tax=Spongiactinospora sp. TRM90649 TaxID=3031114 RepID=UPI0023F857DF|nr:YfjP family GTPase [Spongiactinospora sp. TRM90649]MDF5757784.1 YfjP family GTPase [Spongiactinospora sp. TRM90649]